MESNEQTELRGKIETDRESRMIARWRGGEGGGIEQNGTRTRGHGQQCGDCRDSIRGLNGNGKNKIK